MIGDLTGDCFVSTSDLTIMLGNFGVTGVEYADGDLTGDGAVTTSDLTVMLGNFGLSCPGGPTIE